MATFKLDNRAARRLWLTVNHLMASPATQGDSLALVKALGFVQLDSIQVVSRAHHHILWTRDHSYREPDMNDLLGPKRQVFEHFTHDASILPMEFLPIWARQFQRMKDKVGSAKWFGNSITPQLLDHILRRISDEGPLSTRDFDTKITGDKAMWKRPPHKQALDYLWYAGELATSHRVGFTKFYDLAERVFPADLHAQRLEDPMQIDQLCSHAMDRLGVASAVEIRKFWDATEPREVTDWIKGQGQRRGQGQGIIPIEVESWDGSWTKAFAPADIESRVENLPSVTSRLRILNPFDPAIRDRKRLKRLFGYDYTVEMFVPAAKRVWGYYVYPILEGDRFVGRIEVKAERAKNSLNVVNLWFEPDVSPTQARLKKLDTELRRLTGLAGVRDVIWLCLRP
ncbi:hypothetical protein EDD53_2005 [Pacificibacter maritimus]|uniref:Winged helix-turn-helix domain-containing protein n=1 Tax=Pacificibacter maritimus TaxID=762213 RepID=A0A3N4UCZ4_9RHOB|nr:crosslink repair DNA glycosylase YcaQ family protein [Pacificibacter maritimus]RPE66305.1 hypothetical protein EDD53_2005 [Pacificibacter maritimus]